MYWDSKILVNCPSQERPPLFQGHFFIIHFAFWPSSQQSLGQSGPNSDVILLGCIFQNCFRWPWPNQRWPPRFLIGWKLEISEKSPYAEPLDSVKPNVVWIAIWLDSSSWCLYSQDYHHFWLCNFWFSSIKLTLWYPI